MPSNFVRTLRHPVVLAVFPAAALVLLTLSGALVPLQTECPDSALSAPHYSAVANHVLLVSVDGLHPEAIDALGPAGAPNFYRLRNEGAWTNNARTDPDHSVTLPNHVSQLTGRMVGGACGHRWTDNRSPKPNSTIHLNKGFYVNSVFNVLNAFQRRGVLFASKKKFALFPTTYGEGAEGVIDRYVQHANTDTLVSFFTDELVSTRFAFGFLHLRDPDAAGHKFGWSLSADSEYLQAVCRVDRLIGQLLQTIEEDTFLSGQTALIVTADHGGRGKRHRAQNDPHNFTIPFYVWGAGASAADLYSVNLSNRANPGARQVGRRSELQPIRNGDAANLALGLLGLPDVPGSTINRQDTRLAVGKDDSPRFTNATR